MGHDFGQVGREIQPQAMVYVKLVLTRRCEVLVVNLEGSLDEGFVVSLHSRLAWSTPASRSSSLGTRRDIELALEILDIQPKGQVLLAKVGFEEIAKESAIRWLFQDVVQAIHVALDVALLFASIIGGVELLRHGDATMDLGIGSANQCLRTALRPCFNRGVALDRRTVIMGIGGRTAGRSGCLVPLSNPLSFFCDFVNRFRSASELAVLLKRGGLEVRPLRCREYSR